MKTLRMLMLFSFLASTPSYAFDWNPLPKISLKDIGDFFSDVWRDFDDAVLEPIVNFGEDGIDFLGDQLVDMGLAPNVKVEIKKIVAAHLRDPFGIVLAQSDNTDVKWSLTVLSDPATNLVVFQDNKNKSNVNVPGTGSRSIPSMGVFDARSAGLRLSGPKGLTTNHRGDFWVADSRNHRIISFFYDPLEKAMKYVGSMGHFSNPSAVSHSPGISFSESDDLIYIANTDANSLCRLPADFIGEGYWEDQSGAICFDGKGTVIFTSISAIAVENNSQEGAQGDPNILYVAYANNKVAKIRDDGDSITVLEEMQIGDPQSVKITGLTTDFQGFLYVVDNGGGKVEYYATNGNFDKIFSFGKNGTSSTLNEVQFNQPRMLALYEGELFVTEAWGGNSGIQRFKAIPTIDRDNTHIEVSLDFPGDMDVNAKISTRGRVSIELALYENISTMADPTVVWIKNPTDLPIFGGGKGYAAFAMEGNTGVYSGIQLPENRLYRMTVKSYMVDDVTHPVDVFVKDMVLSKPGQQQPYSVQMKETGISEPDISKPTLIVTNQSQGQLQGFTVRMWMDRGEMPSQSIVVDRYYTEPSSISASVGYHPRNPNLVFADFTYPTSFQLNPGQSTSDPGFQFGIHFQNYWPGKWKKSNDFSWQGISEVYNVTRNITILGSDGRILYGDWPVVNDLPTAPQPPANRHPVLGFGRVADWSAPQALISLDTVAYSEGKASLSIAGAGWFTLQSVPIATAGITGELATLALDVFLPGSQPNPWWLGSVDLLASCPSANIHNAYLGHVELTPLPQQRFSTISFTVPEDVLAALRGDYSDFSLQFNINVNAGAPPLLFDNLRFVQ